MATKTKQPVKQSTSRAVAAPPAARPTAVVPLSDRMAARAQRHREQVALAPNGGAQSLSFRGGTISLGDERIGKELPCFILATQFERTYYPSAYVADEKKTPSCYSYDNVAPHKDAPYPQSKSCKDCEYNAFGSEPTRGKGKACKEGLRIALVRASDLASEAPPPTVIARFSTMNAQAVGRDLKSMMENGIDHPLQAASVVTCEPDPKRQIANGLLFEGYTPEDVFERLEPMCDAAEAMLVQPYPTDKADDPAKVKATPGRGRTTKKY